MWSLRVRREREKKWGYFYYGKKKRMTYNYTYFWEAGKCNLEEKVLNVKC
jgi:hypothetical protein